VLVPCRYQSIKLKTLWVRHINTRPLPDHETKYGVTRTCYLDVFVVLILGRFRTKLVPDEGAYGGKGEAF
jgi:hypothetical protein